MFIAKFAVIILAVYVATSLVNKDEYIIYYAYTSAQSVITFDRLGSFFRFVYIHACILLCFFVLLPFLSVNKDIYKAPVIYNKST